MTAQNARATTQEGRRGPSTTQVAANKTDREGSRIRIRGGDRAAPKNPINGRQSTTQKLPQHRSTPQREDNMAGSRDAQTAPQFHRQTTATTPQSEQNLPTKRTAPRHANRCEPNTKRQQTHTEATKQMTPTPSTNQPPRSRAKRTDARRDTSQTGHEEGTRQHKTNDQRDARRRLGDHQRTEDRRGNRSRKAHPSARTDVARRTTSTGKPRNRDTKYEETSGTDAAEPNEHEKHREGRKDSKTRSKQMVVGGKTLAAREMRGPKLPINPVYFRKIPINPDDCDQAMQYSRSAHEQEQSTPEQFRLLALKPA